MELTQVSNAKATVTTELYADISEKLRAEAKNRPVFNAVAHMFSKRERSRGRITLGALIRTMTKLDYNFSKEDYAEVLAFLARIEIGVLDRDTKGNLRSLKDIRFTLQSVGMVATSRKKGLEYSGIRTTTMTPKVRHIEREVEAAKVVVEQPAPVIETPRALPVDKPSVDIKLQVTMDGNTHASFEVPNKITPNQLIALLAQFFNT